jgi:anaerobic dimethyl sulfoxide reductase subunit C (anchor subunit)
MRAKDLPLVFFTLFVQAAVGSFLALAVLSRGIARGIENVVLDDVAEASSVSIFVLLVVGVIIATGHLSKRTKAHLAVGNLGSSWLSREALLGLGFGLSTVFFAVANFLNPSPLIQDLGAVAGSILGLALVYCISRLYMLRTVPAWNTPATPMSFFTTTLLLGLVLVGLELTIVYFVAEPFERQYLRIAGILEQIGILSMALVGVQVFALRLSLFYSKKNPGFPSVSHHRRMLTMRVILSAAGTAIFWISTIGLVGDIESSPLALSLMTLGTALVFTGEILGRFLFFALYKRVGL